MKRAGGFAAALTIAASAAIPAWADTNPAPPNPDRDATVQVSPLLAPPRPAAPAAKLEPTGNPLWGIPLSTLTATRERPIFSPSRRPAAPVVAVPVPSAAAPAAPMPAMRPNLIFVGAIAGEAEGFAIFLEPASRSVVRLRTGQTRDGWVLKSVNGRQATLQRDELIEVFTLPAPSASVPPPNAEPAHLPGPVLPAGTAVPSDALVTPGPGGDFAPFVPQHTPKDGKPDGL